jgi:glycosyltransferase involved in cell wall biosynthesis
MHAAITNTSGKTGRLRIVLVFHLAEVTGPALTLLPRARRLAEREELSVVFPGEGTAELLYSPFARTSTARYVALTIPRSPWAAFCWLGRFARETARFLRLFRSEKPDVVVVVTTVLPSALLAARLTGRRVVVYAAEVYDPPEAGRQKRILGRALCRYVGLLGNVVANSARVASQFPHARHLTVITPTASSDFAGGNPKPFRTQPALADADPLIVSAGNLTFGRGQDVLIHALVSVRRALPRAHCVIAGAPHPRAGDRAYADSLRALVGELGLADAVTFTGFVKNVTDLYAAADMVVNPARSPESFGRVALEALVAGRPFIGSRVGAIPDVIRDEVDGLLVEPDDPDQLAAAIIRIARDDELRTRLVTQGQQRMRETFDEERATSEFVDFVCSSAARKQRDR